MDFDENTKKNIQEWLNGPYDEKIKDEIKRLSKENPKTLKNSFFQRLHFGTGGARGLMGIGTNRFNLYTISFITQGLANYLKKIGSSKSCLIGFDNRNFSKEFAEKTAQVLAGNGIKVFLFKDLRPTPLVSFGCRYKKCDAAVMITASHNPPEYNGFKVYWKDGGQVLPPHDKGIIEEVNKITSPNDVKTAPLDSNYIEIVNDEIDRIYIEKLEKTQNLIRDNSSLGSTLQIIYTNLHGTGITLMPQALASWGFTSFSFVEKQKTIDKNFSFAPLPNPEEKEALKLGIELLKNKKADIFIATDPDADRLAVVILHDNEPIIFSGNQVACIILEHLCKHKKIEKNSACIKSIVTTELFASIAKKYDVECIDVLTGFKYISEKIALWDENNKHSFLFGAEESLGYLAQTLSHDKDAIGIACLLCEIALQAKKKKMTLLDNLYSLYEKHGIFREKLFSISFEEGQEGMEKMKNIMTYLRKNPLQLIGNCQVTKVEDFFTQIGTDITNKKNFPLHLPKSDVLRYWLSDNTKIIIRPSGTEPKIKIYLGAIESTYNSIKKGIDVCDARLDMLQNAMKEEIQTAITKKKEKEL